MCGEKSEPICYFVGFAGSPPLVRGKAEDGKYYNGATGITPACAGKSGSPSKNRALYGDHPRLYGEKRKPIFAAAVGKGSPPPVRGKVPLAEVQHLYRRITPACAGKSPAFADELPFIEDHPRLCGEK